MPIATFFAKSCTWKQCSARARAFTVLFVPHSGQKAQRLRLPAWALGAAAVFVLTFVGGLSWFGYDYVRLRANERELVRLRIENCQQAEQIESLAQEAAAVQERLVEVDQLDAEVRALLGLPSRGEEPEPTLSRGRLGQPQGGPGRRVTTDDIQATLQAAAAGIDPQKEKLAQLQEEVRQEQQRLAHTPSGRPVQGTITSRYGTRRSPYGRRTEFHEGIDIAAPYGTAVKATGAGTVVYSAWRSGYGRMVVIDHGYGYRTAYAHNSKNKVSVGTTVERGDVIAYVGSSGRSTGPHLHYEVIYLGVKKDPARYF